MTGDSLSKATLFESLFHTSRDGMLVVDRAGYVVQYNEAAQKLLLLQDGERVRVDSLFVDYTWKNVEQHQETRLKYQPDKIVVLSQYPVRAPSQPWGRLLVVRDITACRRLEQTLTQERERLQAALESIREAVIITDAQGLVDYSNPVAEQFTGWKDAAARGRTLAEVIRLVAIDSDERIPDPVQYCLRRHGPHAVHALLPQQDGHHRVIEYLVTPIYGSTEVSEPPPILGSVLVFQDVTEVLGMAQQMAYQATYDSLTGLLNRQTFEKRLEEALQRTRAYGESHVLCYLDLDQFKVVNDTCGHRAGDQLLRQISALLHAQVRQADIISRLGGDEFGIILTHCPLTKAMQIAEELRRVIKEFRFIWHGKSFELGVSIGLVPLTAQNETLAEVLSAADAACYVAKEQGRNRVQVYRPNDRTMVQRYSEMQWVHRLMQALTEERFCLYMQDIVPVVCETPERSRAELLLRMVDEQGQLVLPGDFIPAAERYNLMPTLDRWVIRTAFTLMASGGTATDFPACVAINLSGQSLCDEQFLTFVIEQFRSSGVSPRRVCFEVTETAAIANLERATAFMRTLRDMGCQFALDDFGSGLSSFPYLKSLPVDYVKIDGRFVQGILDDPVDYSMVEAINRIGHVMGIQTIAEFVENEAIFHALRTLGVDYAQGYGIARPKPLWLPPRARGEQPAFASDPGLRPF